MRALLVSALVLVGALAACGGSAADDADNDVAVTELVAITTTLPPQALAPPRTAPEPKVTTSVPTTTQVPVPAGFPRSIPLPQGEVGYYTGSPTLGFHLNLSTLEDFAELVRFFSSGIADGTDWEISVRDVGRGFLPGFEGEWAIYTADDHVLTQILGEYQGVIEVEGRHVNILLDPLEQPAAGEAPAVLPSTEELPLPERDIEVVQYSAGLVRMTYAVAGGDFEALLAEYRDRGWTERGAAEQIAVGDLAGWRVTLEHREDGSLAIDFENLALSYP